MAQYISVIPAYGDDYKTQAEVKAAWKDGKDFQVTDIGPSCGRYVNNKDAAQYTPGAHYTVRYGKGMKLVQVT